MAGIHPELAAARARAEAAGAEWEAHPSGASGRENAAAADALVLAEVRYNHELPWAEPEAGAEPYDLERWCRVVSSQAGYFGAAYLAWARDLPGRAGAEARWEAEMRAAAGRAPEAEADPEPEAEIG